MRPIIIRTLRRTFIFLNQPTDSPLWFLGTEPVIDGEAPEITMLHIGERHGFFTLDLPIGRKVEGTLRNIARAFDDFSLSCAVADEGDAISLPAALLTSPEGKRV